MRPWMLGALAVTAAAGIAVLRHAPLKTVEAAEGTPLFAPGAPAAAKLAPRPSKAAERSAPPPSLANLDLSKLAVDDSSVSAPAGKGRTARLTLDPELQRTAARLLDAYKLPEATIVMADPATGELLVYASRVEGQKQRDLAIEATAPAASVFKIITGAALVEKAGLTPDTRQCYSGGEHEIRSSDLEDNPRRDRWCISLAGAMGRSTNTVFARLALKHLSPGAVDEVAKSFGFGEPVPFDVPVAPSALTLPREPLGFARTAAGFWNSTLSPIESLWISTILARGGEAPRLRVVREVVEEGKSVWTAKGGPAPAVRRVVSAETAQAVTTMMERTVSEGTSYRAFRDRRGASFLPDIPVAGKTGTLTDGKAGRFYTWFTGFAPSRPSASRNVKPVAIAVLVVNEPAWKVKANVVAREMLRAYFAAHKVERVSSPKVDAVARR